MAVHEQPAVRIAGLPPGVAPGPLGTRFVAYVIDTVVVAVLAALPAVLVWFTNLSPTVIMTVSSLLLLAWALLVWWMFAARAAGPGMRLLHLQLVGLANGRPIGWGWFLVRQLILFGLGITGIGLLVMVIFLAQHPRRQGWHDLAVNSVVIKERRMPPSHQAAEPRHAVATGATDRPTQPPAALAPVDQTPLGPPAGYPTPLGPPAGSPAPQRPPDRSAPTADGSPGVSVPTQSGPGARSYQGTPADPGPQPLQPPSYGSAPSPSAVRQPLQPPPGSPQELRRPPGSPPGSSEPGPPIGPADRAGPGPGAGPGSSPTASGSWRAVLDDGREIGVDGLVLLGRNPQARPGEEHATLIKVADTTRTVSKSHLELGLNSRGLYVADRGSTNGSTVTSVSGMTKRCAPGDPVQVEPGSIVSFGDHWLEVRHY